MPNSGHPTAPAGSIVLAAHDPSWAARFADEASLVTAALGGVLAELHHIGSTAVPGIVAKPVIDMLAVVWSVEALDASAPALAALGYEALGYEALGYEALGYEALGYEALGEFGIPGRRYFRKESAAGVRTHQLHAFATGSTDVERHLGFRDYLRAHPREAHAYERLKKDLAERSAGSTRAYSSGKTAFVREVERRAATWRRDSPGR